jgi:hypothetical protein
VKHRPTALLAIAAALALVVTSCAARNKVEGAAAEEDDGATTAARSSGAAAADEQFGDLPSPCGAGEYTVAPDDAGGSTDKLLIGVPNDRTSQIRNGLNKELWDSSVAFAAWCNEQGGIGGLPIELVDLDGKLLEVEAAMTKACGATFMHVGGGNVQDNLQFSGKPDSDFHLCRMAEIPGFTVSPEKSESNGQIGPIPHPSAEATSLWLRDFKVLHPEEAESMVEVWGNLPAMQTIKNQTVAIFEGEDVENAGVFDYPVVGLDDWTPLAQKVIRTGTQSMHFVGEPTNLGTLVKTLREQGWEGYPVVETNAYDQTFLDSAGAGNAEGTIVRSVFHPFEEADDWPAVQQYLDILRSNVDDAKEAVLGMQSFSAWLLFATAANACAESDDGELSRACVLEAADGIDGWTAGGLHAPTDPGPEGGPSPECAMLLTVADGAFERLHPEVGSDADEGDGFSCEDDAVVEVPANEGLGKIGPDQPI